MKKILSIIVVFMFFVVLETISASAQSSGRWTQCVDPATGFTARCYILDSNASREYPPPQNQTYDQAGVYDRSEPVYQRQRRRIVRQEYDIGVNPYSNRPFGRYTRITETTTIIVETNAPSYQPNIRVDVYGNGYNWSRYTNW